MEGRRTRECKVPVSVGKRARFTRRSREAAGDHHDGAGQEIQTRSQLSTALPRADVFRISKSSLEHDRLQAQVSCVH